MNDQIDATPTGDSSSRRTPGFIYACIRRVHLYTGLILLTFITMYFVSGIAMVHADWFGKQPDPVKSETTHTLETGLDPSADGFAADLQRSLDIPGRRFPVQNRGDAGWRVRYERPGLEHVVDVAPDRSVRVERTEYGFRQTLVHFHRLPGYGGGAFYDAWAFIMDLVNASMIVFALTGIYMWWKLTKRHTLGWIVLAGSYGYAAAMIGYLWLSP